MSTKDFDIVNFDQFVAQYMAGKSESLVPQSSAIRIYPLSIAPSIIQPPTPLFRAEYSFLLLFTDGGGQQQVDNEILDLCPNDVLFIREGHLNAITSIDARTQGYYIYIENTLLTEIFINRTLLNRFTFYPKFSVTPSAMDWLSKCCELLIKQNPEDIYFKEIQSSLLKAIVLKLADSSSGTLSKPDRQSEITMLFKELLYDHFIEKREITFYADALAVSENYLNRCVNHITNKPPKQHINELVIFYSKTLLQDRSKDISQVAFELNFSDPSYYSRLFKQLTQQTPTAYRNSLMQD